VAAALPRLLHGAAPGEDQPEAGLVRRETIGLVFVAAVQVLPPRQRTHFSRGTCPAGRPARRLRCWRRASPPRTSAVQRARDTMQKHLPATRTEWSGRAVSDEEQALLDRFIDAHQRAPRVPRRSYT